MGNHIRVKEMMNMPLVEVLARLIMIRTPYANEMRDRIARGKINDFLLSVADKMRELEKAGDNGSQRDEDEDEGDVHYDDDEDDEEEERPKPKKAKKKEKVKVKARRPVYKYWETDDDMAKDNFWHVIDTLKASLDLFYRNERGRDGKSLKEVHAFLDYLRDKYDDYEELTDPQKGLLGVIRRQHAKWMRSQEDDDE